MRGPRFLGGLVFPWVALFVVSTASGSKPPGTGVWTVLIENDLFYSNDRNYTNGVALVWAPRPDPTSGWAISIARSLPWLPKGGTVRRGYGLGQSIYTPRDIKLADPPIDDRPYAGWLYGSVGLSVESGHRLDQLALTLGVIGPASLAEQSQEIVHRITGVDNPRGWATQLRNEPGIELIYDRSWRGLSLGTLAGLGLDLTPHVGVALGNVATYASVGWTIRYGTRQPLDYGSPRVQPSMPASGSFEPTRHFSWHLFAGSEGRAVARDVFLDGNTFIDSRSVDKVPLVGDLYWGVALTWRSARLSYTHIVSTPEFETQDRHDDFGSISFSMAH